MYLFIYFFFFFQAEDGIRDVAVTGVQTCALPISRRPARPRAQHQHPGQVPRPDAQHVLRSQEIPDLPGPTRYQVPHRARGGWELRLERGAVSRKWCWLVATSLAMASCESSCPTGNDEHILTVKVEGGGTVTSNIGALSCPGACTLKFATPVTVVLTEVPATGNYFLNWGGLLGGLGYEFGCSGTSGSVTLA